MDNFDKLDEPVISSLGRKKKIKAETFSQNLAKAAGYNGEGKLCNNNHTVYDHSNNVCQGSILSAEETTEIKQVISNNKYKWSYLFLQINSSNVTLSTTFNMKHYSIIVLNTGQIL